MREVLIFSASLMLLTVVLCFMSYQDISTPESRKCLVKVEENIAYDGACSEISIKSYNNLKVIKVLNTKGSTSFEVATPGEIEWIIGEANE